MPPKKQTEKTKPSGHKPFNILTRGASLVDATRESLGRSASDVLAVGTPNKPKHILPFSSFALQSIFHARGLVSGTIIDVLGADGLGKTSLSFYLMGQAMAANGACMYIETEGKPLGRERAERCLHSNREIASSMYDAIYKESARELREAANKIEKWVLDMRKPGSGVPMSSPLFVVLDTFSKLMSPKEAEGFAAYATETDKDKAEAKEKMAAKKAKAKGKEVKVKEKVEVDESKELGTGSNFGHAKLSQEWSRRMPYYLSRYNVIFVLIRHQNDKVDMGGGGGGNLSADQKDAFNRTSIGGRAWLQSAAYEIILSKMGYQKATIDKETVKTALDVKFSVCKNGWGPLLDGKYRLTMIPRQDTDDWLEPAINFDQFLPLILSNRKLMKVSVKNDSTCVSSDFNTAQRAEEMPISRFCELFYADPARVEALGKQLGFAHNDAHTTFPKQMTVSMHRPAPGVEPLSDAEPDEEEEQPSAEATAETPEPVETK